MKNLCLLFTLFVLLGCSKKDDIQPDMTAALIGNYDLTSQNTMGEERNLHLLVSRQSDSTVNVRLTKFFTPFKGTPSLRSDTTITGIVVRNTQKLEFAYVFRAGEYVYDVDIDGTIYQGYLYVKSQFLKMEFNYYGGDFKFEKQ